MNVSKPAMIDELPSVQNLNPAPSPVKPNRRAGGLPFFATFRPDFASNQ
jgi:hypothetical protein